MGRQVAIRDASSEGLFATLDQYLSNGATVVPGTLCNFGSIEKIAPVPISDRALEALWASRQRGQTPLLHVGEHVRQSQCYSVVVELPDDWEERKLANKYVKMCLGNAFPYPMNTPRDKKFFENSKNLLLYDVANGKGYSALSAAEVARVKNLFTAAFERGKYLDLKPAAERTFGKL